MALQAGTARVEITPPVGTPLAGFAARDHGCEGIHDPLFSKALVLDDGQTRLCLVTNDLLGLPNAVVEQIRAEVEATAGITAGHVMVNCSHTHSGPMLRDSELATATGRQIAGAVKMAAASLQPARLGAGRGPVQVGINRRELRDGEIVLGRDPNKPVTPYVDVLRVDTAEGAPLAVLFHHACHPVTRAASSYLVSADYPGAAQAIVQQVHPGALAMFAQGCSGNINAEPVGGSWEDVRRLGTMLAGEVLKVRELVATSDEVHLAAAAETVYLPCERVPELEKSAAEIARYEAALTAAEAGGKATEIRMQQAFLDTWRKLHTLKEEGRELEPLEFRLQGLALGDVALVGLPGEIFIEYALEAERVSPFAHTLLLGCTNGSGTYVPSAAALSEGGYEVSFTPLWWGRLPFAPELEPVLNGGIARVLQALRQ